MSACENKVPKLSSTTFGICNESNNSLSIISVVENSNIWHYRLLHISTNILIKIPSIIDGIKHIDTMPCFVYY